MKRSSVFDCSCPSPNRTIMICNGEAEASGDGKLRPKTLSGKDFFTSNSLDHLRLKANTIESPKNEGQILSKKKLDKNTDQKGFVGNLRDGGRFMKHSKHFQQRGRLNAIVDDDGSGSSSDDEESKLFFCKSNKVSIEMTHSVGQKSAPFKEPRGSTQSHRFDKFMTVSLQEEKELNVKKRIGGKHGSLSKKIKLSRPCLDMDKMLAHKFETVSSVKAV